MLAQCIVLVRLSSWGVAAYTTSSTGCQSGNVLTLSCLLMFHCLRNLAPSYLMNTCQPVTRNLRRRCLHSAVCSNCIVPPTTVGHCPRSFADAGSSTCNVLPAPLGRNDELAAVSFHRQLKTELYIKAYYSH